MKLEGKPLLAAMCIGQVGNLLTHVVVGEVAEGDFPPGRVSP